MSFRIEEYIKLLDMIKKSGRNVYTVSGKLSQTPNNDKKIIVIRHDVDRRTNKAIKLACLEYQFGLCSTYYFRADNKGRFNAPAIRKIASLGHEVGYHYETFKQFGGNHTKAYKRFKENLARFREIAQCRTVCMHGSPASKYSNLEIGEMIDLNDTILIGDAVKDMENCSPLYITDTAGMWNAPPPFNMRDKVGTFVKYTDTPNNSNNFYKLLCNSRSVIYINIHPERWCWSRVDYILTYRLDQVLRLAKSTILKYRNLDSV